MLVLPLLLAAAPLATFQDTAQIDRAVAAFTGQPIGATGGARSAVDPRLKLAPCTMVSLAWREANHDSVVVTCTGPAWRVFVPAVMAASQPAALTPAMSVAAAPQPPVIKRGDPVTIAANSDGFSITRDGVAMGDAAPGGRLLVKVDDGKPPVQAIALQSGEATLPGWSE